MSGDCCVGGGFNDGYIRSIVEQFGVRHLDIFSISTEIYVIHGQRTIFTKLKPDESFCTCFITIGVHFMMILISLSVNS